MQTSASTTSPAAASNSFRIHPITAEFAESAVEQRYREAMLPSLHSDFRAAIGVGAVFYSLFGVTDYVALGPSIQFWILFLVRVAVSAAAIIAIDLAKRRPNVVMSGAGATWLEVAAIVANFFIVTQRPNDLAAHASAMIVILMAIYVFVPNRFVLAVGAALLGTASFIVFLFGWAQSDGSTAVSLVAVLLLINTFGIVAAYRFSQLRRREFAALESERKSNEALLAEISRREGLEHALTVEKTAAENARDQAEAASRAKSRFFAAASHDLRQPMHALSLFAATLVERLRYPEVRNIADQMQASIVSLTSLFDSLLDISKLDAGTIQARVVSFRLQEIFDNVRRDFGGRAASKGIRLHVVPTQAVIRSDPLLLERIVRNLAANAVNYTTHGGVVIGVRRRRGRLCIEVWDSGPGIHAAEQQRIFEEFYQIANPERDRSKGLGLGLAIVKRLSDLLGHPVEVRSDAGHGAMFCISVPRGILRHSEPVDTTVPTLGRLDGSAQRLVVLIEDERIIREATQTLLSDWGCQVIASASVADALAQLAEAGKNPDLIIADYRLREGATGIEAIKTIRERCNAATPAVLITGDAAAEYLKQAQEQGFPVLHKPVAPAKLRALIASIQPLAQ
jgi:signal transduction histidine kinase/CheY-like chemotaxis protein